jgi:hypothetical protein
MAKANALNSVYKLYVVVNITLYVTSCIYNTARLTDDVIIIYYDYYNFRHWNSPYAFRPITHPARSHFARTKLCLNVSVSLYWLTYKTDSRSYDLLCYATLTWQRMYVHSTWCTVSVTIIQTYSTAPDSAVLLGCVFSSSRSWASFTRLQLIATLRWIIVASLHSKAIQESCSIPNMKNQRWFETSGCSHPTRCHIAEYLNLQQRCCKHLRFLVPFLNTVTCSVFF